MKNKKYRYISQQFLEQTTPPSQESSFWSFSFPKLLTVLGMNMLPAELKGLVHTGLLFSGKMALDATYLFGSALPLLKNTAEEYIKGKKYKCLLKSGIEKNICIRNSYDEVIRELESKKMVCNKAKDQAKKDDCLDYINQVQQKWRQRKQDLVNQD